MRFELKISFEICPSLPTQHKIVDFGDVLPSQSQSLTVCLCVGEGYAACMVTGMQGSLSLGYNKFQDFPGPHKHFSRTLP